MKSMSNKKYFDDLTLEEMFKNHDFTYQMSDDNRYYEQGRRQSELINAKLKERGGWTKELVDEWNKYAPGDKPWETNVEYPNMTWKKKYSDVL
tara:strand:- start:1298 stop:1576 length:279 start_codon:yes stop_codon:yes gene_type:complete